MSLLTWTWQPLSMLVLLLLTIAYLRGWNRLRRVAPALATRARVVAFGASMLLIATALISPLYGLTEYLLAARAVQKVLICMLAPPLFWLACPVHTIIWGLPVRARRTATHYLLRKSTPRRVLRVVTQPGIAWLIFVSAFLLWHEPTYAAWTLQHARMHSLSVWLLLGAALLYWWHVVGTGPRIHATLPLWASFVYLVGVEVPNMMAGVSIAFSTAPLYTYYAAIHASLPQLPGVLAQLGVMQDQMLGGGIIWIVGSIVYISSIVLVLNHLFAQEDQMPPLLQFSQEADERTIAPGLEYRVQRNRWREAGYQSGERSK